MFSAFLLHAHMHTPTCTRTHACMHMLTHVYTCAHTCACMYTRVHAPMQAAQGGAGTLHPQSSLRGSAAQQQCRPQQLPTPFQGRTLGLKLPASEGKGCRDQTHFSPVISLHSAHTLCWPPLNPSAPSRTSKKNHPRISHAAVMMKGLEVPPHRV